MTPPRKQAQIGLEDKIINNPELEALLEERQELKPGVSEYRAADKKAKEAVLAIDTPTPFRVGRFIITKQAVPAKSVAFDVNESSRVTIKTVDE